MVVQCFKTKYQNNAFASGFISILFYLQQLKIDPAQRMRIQAGNAPTTTEPAELLSPAVSDASTELAGPPESDEPAPSTSDPLRAKRRHRRNVQDMHQDETSMADTLNRQVPTHFFFFRELLWQKSVT